MNEEERYKRAKERVEALKGFYTHLAVYLAVNAGLFLINVVTSSNWWFYWPMLGWGIGLAVHAMTIFVTDGWFGPAWEERKIKEYMNERGQNAPPAPPAQAA